MTLTIACSNPRFTYDFVKNGLVCVFDKSIIHSKRRLICFRRFFVKNVRASARSSLQYCILVK